MANEILKQNGRQKISAAFQFEQQKAYTSAIVNYQEGIKCFEALLNPKYEISKDFQSALIQKIKEYNIKLSTLKEKLSELLKAGNYEECLDLVAGSRHNGYRRLFEHCFAPNPVNEIRVSDPDIQAPHQIENLVHFCEVVVKLSKNELKKIFVTTVNTNNPEQKTMFQQLTKSLRYQDVLLIYQLQPDAQIERKIEFSNGWLMRINHGLNYLEIPNEFSPGIHDFDLRLSLSTQIRMLYSPT